MQDSSPCNQPIHDHSHSHHERATSIVLALTLITMLVELLAGWWTGSVALLADGWHMGMHGAAMGVAVFAYRFARWHQASDRFAFGAGKAGDLGAFANAVMLAVVAILIAGEALERLMVPAQIAFGPALTVAIVGLAVNFLSAWLLREAPHAHDCGHDHNREAAFVHVVSDALTSVLAIIALFCGQRFGLTWLDPLTAVLGAVIILRWALALGRRSGLVLLDGVPDPTLPERIRAITRNHGGRLRDLHIWPISAGRYAVVMNVDGPAADYRAELANVPGVVHVTVEREQAEIQPVSTQGHPSTCQH